MPKADGDPTKRNEPSTSEEPVKPNPATQPDEIPPVHVLEAMQDQDRKETEDLLAGFDRPARTPKQPAVNRDFVDFHLKREKSPRSDPPKRQRSQHDVSTVLVPKKAPVPYLLWIGAAAGVIAAGVLVALVLTSVVGDSAKNAGATPSAATTISAATTPSSDRSSEIPPPPPPETVAQPADTAPSNITPPPAPTTSAKSKPRPTATSTTASTSTIDPVAPTATTPPTTATAPTKPPPRDDFIRDL